MAKSVFLAVLLLTCFVLASCEIVKVKDCGSAMSTIEEVDVTPCPSHPCQLKRGTQPTVEVKFVPKENITKATNYVKGIIGGVPIPFPLKNPNACDGHGITCPMAPGKEYTFKTSLEVKTEYPQIELVVKWEMLDQNEKVIFCWELPVEIV